MQFAVFNNGSQISTIGIMKNIHIFYSLIVFFDLDTVFRDIGIDLYRCLH